MDLSMTFHGLKKSADQVYALWRVRRTICEMLMDRGYVLTDEDLRMDEYDFAEKYDGKYTPDLMIQVAQETSDSEQIMVWFPQPVDGSEMGRVNAEIIEALLKHMREKAIARGIIVTANKLLAMTERKIRVWEETQLQLTEKRHKIELFLDKELLVNITHHERVPKHCILTDDEKATLLARYGLRDGQLPRCQVTDPLARYYGLERGQIMQIVRHSETAGRYITYRLVSG